MVVMVLAAALAFQPSHTLSAEHLRVLSAWLGAHQNYRPATDLDCECAADIEQMRRGWDDRLWKPVPDYHPYQVVGDFNGDGFVDFAVVVVDTARTANRFSLAVFNGPFGKGTFAPAFLESDLDLRHQGLFFGPPRPKPYRLILGPFESDNTGLLLPAGRTYRWDTSHDDE